MSAGGDFSTMISNTPIIDLTAFIFWLFGLPGMK
jgi:hypothetical protein